MEELEQLEKTRKLTPKQELFCQEYIQCLNQTVAYMKAYGTENRSQAQKLGSRLMLNEVVKKRVDELKAEIIARYQLTREQVVDMAMNVYLMAKEGMPEKKLNRDGKFVDTGNTVRDYRAMNDAVKNIASMCGFNSTELKAEIKAQVDADVNVMTAKDVAKAIMDITPETKKIEDDIDA